MVEGRGIYLVTMIAADGTRYVFDGKTPLKIVSGTALPDVRMTNSAKPLMNYSYVECSTLAPRKISALLQVLGDSSQELWVIRQKMLRLFNPAMGPFTLQVSYPNKNEVYYAYNVILTDAMDSPLDTKRDVRYAEFPLTLLALDPFWYGALHTEAYSCNESAVITITDGTAYAKPVITITGEVDGPYIYNTLWSGVDPYLLEVVGAVAAGDSVVIDCRQHTVTRTSGAGVALTYTSTLNSFGLIPSSIGASGINNITLASRGAAQAGSGIVIEWRDTYFAI